MLMLNVASTKCTTLYVYSHVRTLHWLLFTFCCLPLSYSSVMQCLAVSLKIAMEIVPMQICIGPAFLWLPISWLKEASKVKQTNKAKQHSTPKAVTFPKKNELPRVGLEPTTCTSILYIIVHTCTYMSICTLRSVISFIKT